MAWSSCWRTYWAGGEKQKMTKPNRINPFTLPVGSIADEDIPRKRGYWAEYFQTLLLRLEKTPRSEWIFIKADSEKQQTYVHQALVRHAKPLIGTGVVEITSRKLTEHGFIVLVRRGENWTDRDKRSLAHLPDDREGASNFSKNNKRTTSK